MASKVSQRAVYLVTAAIVVAMVSGFALASLSLGQTSNSYQGSQTTTVTSLTGLQWDFTALTDVNVSTPWALSCGSTAAHACDVTSVSKTVCAGGYPALTCSQGDFIEQVNLTTVAGTPFYSPTPTVFPVIVSLTVFVTGTPVLGAPGTYAGSPIYFEETASPSTTAFIALDFDVGTTAPGTVNSISVIATS